MKQIALLLTLLFSPLLLANQGVSGAERTNWLNGFGWDIVDDYQNHYSARRLGQLALLVGGTGIMANTDIDQNWYDYYQDHIRSSATNRIADSFEPLGRLETVLMTLPVYATGMVLSKYASHSDFANRYGEYGSRALRTFALAVPQQVLFVETLGGERPVKNGDSHWKPIREGRAVSGHSLAGAVPFISAAKMTDNYRLKIPLYALSTLTGLSRINDKKHFPSQVVFGWSLAYLAASSVDDTIEGIQRKVIFTSSLTPDGEGVMLSGVYAF